MTDSLFREIEEELRLDRVRSLWRRYGKYVVSAVLLAGLVAGGGWFHAHRTAQRNAEALAQLDRALLQLQTNPQPSPETLRILESLTADAPAGVRLLAGLQSAAQYQAQNQPDKAVEILNSLRADAAIPEFYRQFAALYGLIATPDQALFEREIDSFLDSAHPLAPLAYWLAAGRLMPSNPSRARELLDALAEDENAPFALRNAASEWALKQNP